MRYSVKKQARMFLLAMAVFIVETILVREFLNIMTVFGMRPSALPPVFGLMFGPVGVFGSSFGNLVADVISGYAPVMIAVGFVSKFAYGILPLLMWNAVDEIYKRKYRPVKFNTTSNVVRYVVIIILNAAIITMFTGLIMQSIGIGLLISDATLMLFFNSFVFCIIIGIPIIMFTSSRGTKSEKIRFSINERILLIFLLLGIISGLLIGFFVVTELTYAISNPVEMWTRIYMYITINLLVFYCISIFFLRYCEKWITVPVESITSIASGLIDSKQNDVSYRKIIDRFDELAGNHSEVGVLAEAFKTLILDIEIYISNLTKVTIENERIATELDVARQLQEDMLPNIFPAFPERDEFDVYAMMRPAKEIGGDLYDFFMIDDDNLGVIIADVSGKGIASALFMVITKTLISHLARDGFEPSEVFNRVNNQLCEGNESAMFVTAWMGILNIRTGIMTYVGAGHEPPLLKKLNGDTAFLTTEKSMMLAAMQNIKYKQHKVELSRGDMLYLYTDGVTDANNTKGEMYGKERLMATLNNVGKYELSDTLLSIESDIDKFVGSEPQFDDITMLALSVR